MSPATTTALLLSLVSAEPRVLDPAYELQIVVAEPDLVTPTGLAFDERGRLLVIECHTHFRPDDYQGPEFDRIRLVEDSDNDGKADRLRTFSEGTTATMGLRRGPDGWMYVATRMEVFRLKDADGDGTAELRENLVHLETQGNYPHNGLSGLAFGPDGTLYVGMGENLGEPYVLIGSDGSRYDGGGEGGNLFRAEADGSKIERIATGFWNPFGLCFDEFGRLFAVDNDPDASPPCRLLHVVPGADFGFQFRYGRAGRHPLQAWHGELPGTLPMVAGTGEAPSAVLQHHGSLWVTSWGHNRIERYALTSAGATVTGVPELVVQGDENFRPVDFALSPTGDLFFTDWVDRSYPLHGKGRLWRLRRMADAGPAASSIPPLSPAEKSADEARNRIDLDSLGSPDPFLHVAAVWGLVKAKKDALPDWNALDAPRQRLGLLEARRWRADLSESARDSLLKAALTDAEGDVALFAIRWIADERLTGFQQNVTALLDRPDLSPRLVRAVVAGLDQLQRTGPPGRKDDPLAGLVTILDDARRPANVRATALRMLPAGHAALDAERLATLAGSSEQQLAQEAIRTMATTPGEMFQPALAAIAGDNKRPASQRADAVVGLATQTERNRKLLETFARGDDIVANGARRSLAASHPPASTDAPAADLATWQSRIGNGWRVFFRPGGAACSRCHTLGGRGTTIGPDLTGIGRRMDRGRLLESILNPAREVGPQYVPWTLVTDDGKVLVGLPAEVRDAVPGVEHFTGTDGRAFTLNTSQIEMRQASTASIMPNGLEKLLTPEELRDLLALLATE